MSEFWQDTSIEKIGDNLWRGQVSERWNVGTVPNGGYLMAIAARTLREALHHDDPLTITGHFVDRALNGPVDLQFEQIRLGKSVSTGALRFVQDGVERARFTATFGDLDKTEGESWMLEPKPVLENPQAFLKTPRFLAIHDRVEMLFDPDKARWMKADFSGKPEHLIRYRFRDGTEPDVLSLPFFADCVPPTVFAKFGPMGWVPTLELTLHVRAKPAPGELLGRFLTRYLINGLMEEDGEIWDSEGKLVAICRQLARYRASTSFL